MNVNLSPREVQVVQLVVDGHPNKIIADILGMSLNTAKFHIRNIMRKFKAGSRARAAVEYLRHQPSPPCAQCAARARQTTLSD